MPKPVPLNKHDIHTRSSAAILIARKVKIEAFGSILLPF